MALTNQKILLIQPTSSIFRFLFLIVLFGTLCTERVLAQQEALKQPVDIEVHEVTLDSVFSVLSTQTDVFFSYNSNLITANQHFTLSEKGTLSTTLKKLFAGMGIDYRLVNGQVVLYARKEVDAKPLYSLSGVVRDRYSHEPVVGAHVFLAGSLKGSSTNFDGRFEITDIEEGNYQLGVSHISYKMDMHPLELRSDSAALAFTLTPKINQLKELKVVALKYKAWKKHYSIFKQEFLGSTPNARKCDILNPEVLDFSFDEKKQSIFVKAYQPLVVMNMALGYELDYYLRYFEIGNGSTRTRGVSSFKPLTPKNDRERKRWERNRLKSYEGSFAHFLSALASDQVEEEGFKLFVLDRLPEGRDSKVEKVTGTELLSEMDGDKAWMLRFPNFLKIVYTREMESSAYVDDQLKHAVGADPYVENYYNSVRRGVKLGKQTSYMRLHSGSVVLSKSGQLSDPLSVSTFGYWSWERVAEYLPKEYDPKQN
jgi:hypothetical protein